MEIELTSDKRASLQQIESEAKPRYVRRARLLLAWDEGRPLSEVAERAGLSERRTRFWMQRFQAEGMQVFPSNVLSWLSESPPEPCSPLPSPDPEPSPVTAEDLAQIYQGDLSHARHVSSLAVQLYDLTQEAHGLDARWRSLLEAAALLHEVGAADDPGHPNRAGRQIIQGENVEGFSPSERDWIGWIVYLQSDRRRFRKKHRSAGLTAQQRRGITVAAGLLRMADGLDCTGTQTSAIAGVRRADGGLLLTVSGADSPRDTLCATDRADLWHKTSRIPMRFESLEPMSVSLLSLLQPSTLSDRPAGPGIEPDDPMSEAGRKVLRLHLTRMLEHEKGTRLGDDIEDLHDMRVATRRMRAALRVFGEYWERKAVKPILQGLRQTGRMLGAVRDLDVFMEKATHYLDSFAEEERPSLDPLLESWRELRDRHRQEMVAYLDGAEYRAFCLRLAEFVETPGMGALQEEGSEPVPTLVSHVAPFAIYHRWAEVMAFGPVLAEAPIDTLHALRIRCKLWRYTLEFFQEVLGPEAKAVIRKVVAVQDHLGDLQDAQVASEMLRDFVNRWVEGQRTQSALQRVNIHGVTGYLAAKQEQMYTLLESFPEAWANLDSEEVRRDLAASVAGLG